MSVTVDILLSLILGFIGYVAVCYYFNGIRWNSGNTAALKLTKNKILYLTVALATAVVMIAMLTYYYKLALLTRIRLVSLVFIILPCAAVDFRLQKIPNEFILSALVIRCIIYTVELLVSPENTWLAFKSQIIGAVVIAGFFMVLLLAFKNSIGMGDIKLFAVMGLYQGLWGVINSVFFSLVASFVISIAFLITKKKGRKDSIAFAPSIFVGTVVAICLAGM